MLQQIPRTVAENCRMTDLNVAASPAATVLAGLLPSTDPQPQNCLYHGVLTPTQLDARPAEIAALISGAAVHDLGWLRRFSVRGDDRFRWLSGMVTNMVNDLPPGSGALNLVLNAQGRIQGDLTVWRQPPQPHGPVAGDPGESDDLELEVTADQSEKLLAHLDHFIIMDDVELALVDGQTALGLTGPKAHEVLAALGLPALPEPLTQTRAEWSGRSILLRRTYGVLADHYVLWIAADHAGVLWHALVSAGAKPVGAAALEAFRIAEGIPAYGVDIVDRDLPQETSLLRALHFNKGCYLGQEIVERIRSRGNVHRHLRSLQLEGPLPDLPALSIETTNPNAPPAEPTPSVETTNPNTKPAEPTPSVETTNLNAKPTEPTPSVETTNPNAKPSEPTPSVPRLRDFFLSRRREATNPNEPLAKLTLDGAEAGHITSAAELPLPHGPRRFAIGMIRAEAEARNLPLNYSVGGSSGSARLLAEAPDLITGMER
jgi:folate-binding protein YgfZ